jgi:hypothetical protein
MSGSGASNLGNSWTKPFSNVNGNYANKMSENYAGGFSSNEIPTGGPNGLHGIKDNVLALSGKVSNLSFFKGGAKSKSKSNIKRKIKNITKLYKMRSKKRAKTIKRKLMKKYKRTNNASSNNNFFLGLSSGGKRCRSRRMRVNQKGGYAQYQNNLPMTPSYSVGGHLSASSSGQANPPPIHRFANAGTGTCTDNYNHFTGKGFASRGH